MANMVKSAGTVVNDSSVGTRPWNTPTEALTDNGQVAFATPLSASLDTTNYLKFTNFGFSIPTTATIDGVYVRVKKASAEYGEDNIIKLVVGGVISGTNKAYVGTPWVTNFLTDTFYGNSSDLWGLTLTPTIVNASDFGIAISAKTQMLDSYANVQIDVVEIRVYYTNVALPNLKARIDGAVKSYSSGSVRIDGALRQIDGIWVRIDGVLKKI